MPNLKTYDLFISHAWKYGDDYSRLMNLLHNAPFFSFRNYSAPSDKPLHNLDATDVHTVSQIQDSITRKIRPVNCVLIIAGMYYNYRRWMQYEISTAKSMGKPIVVIKPFGSSTMPAELVTLVSATPKCTSVGWNTDSIVSAIRQYSL